MHWNLLIEQALKQIEFMKTPSDYWALATFLVLIITSLISFRRFPLNSVISIVIILIAGIGVFGFSSWRFSELFSAHWKLAQAREFSLSGRNDAAGHYYEDAYVLFRQLGDRKGEVTVLVGLGDHKSKFNHYNEARRIYGMAQEIFHDDGDRLGEANVLSRMGDLERNANPELAKKHFYQAAQIYSSLGLKDREKSTLQKARALGNPAVVK